MSLGFDKDYYMAEKLKDIQSKHPEEWKDKTVSDLEKFFKDDHNLTPEQHYEKYGYKEGLAPNKFFDADEYLAAKYNQMVADGKAENITEAKAKFAEGWGDNDPYLHYIKYGASEGVNPSNDFDESSYIDAKVKQMVADGKFPDEASALNAFKASGLSALEHYITYGINEAGIDPVKVSDAERVSIVGKTIALAKGADVITPGAENGTTSDDDTITALSSSLSSEKTLDATDQIDGGEGKDTLKLTMKTHFNGFTGDGKMVNVENLELSNANSFERTFDATGATGIEKIKIDASKGAIKVVDLNSVAEIELSNLAAGTFTASYDAKSAVVTSTTNEDVQKLILKNIGTAESAAGKDDEKYVTLSIGKVEAAEITSSGDKENYVNLSGLGDVKKIVIDGSADMDIEAVDSTLTSFDASKATGSIEADLSSSGELTTIKTGSGNDTITVSASKVRVNGEIVGGEGNDTLVINGGQGTLQPSMTGFETIKFDSLGGEFTLASKNVSDLAKVIVGDVNQDIKVVQSAASDMVVEHSGVNNNNKEIIVDNSGSAVINYASAAASAPTATVSNAYDTKFTNATSLTVNVGKYMTAAGDITGVNAESVTLNVESGKNAAGTTELTKFTGTLTASEAQSFTIDSKGIIGTSTGTGADISVNRATSGKITTGEASFIDLEASVLETLEIAASKGLELALHNSSTLGKLQVLTVNTMGDFKTMLADLTAIANVNLSGTGSSAAVTLQKLGATDLDYDINLTASGLGAGLTTDAIDAGDASVNIDISGVEGAVTLGTIDAGKSVIINANGSLAGELTFGKITAESVDINAGENYVGFTTGNSNKLDIDAGKDVSLVGSSLKANEVDIESTGETLDVNYTGSLVGDTIKIISGASSKSIVVKGDTGNGTDAITVDLTTNEHADKAVIDLTGLTNYETSTITTSDDSGVNESTIKLGANGAADTIQWGANDQKVTVTGFDTTEDNLSFDGAVTGLTATTGTAVTAGGVTAAALVDDKVYVINDGATSLTAGAGESITDYTNLTDVADYLNEGYNATSNGDAAVFVINDLVNDKAYVYSFLDAGTSGIAANTELKLIGVITEESGSAIVANDIA